MANEIRIKVVAEGDRTFTEVEEKAKVSGTKSGKNLGDSLQEGLDKSVPVIAGKVGDGIDEGITAKTRGTGDKAGKQIASEVGRGLNQLLRDLQLPEIDVKADAKTALAELQLVKERVRALAGDNPTIEVKVRTERALGEVEKFAKNFVEEGGKAGSGFISGFTDFISTGKGQIVAVAGALAIAAAPVIGATVAGAVIGAVGAGGIAGGIAIASKDPRVQSALTTMKAKIGTELKSAAEPFVQTSIDGIDKIGHAIEGINFKAIFADSANNARPVIDGIAQAIDSLGTGIQKIEHTAGPVMKEIGQGAAGIGQALGDGLGELSTDSRQGASALHELFMVIDGSISGVFQLVDGLSKVYGALEKISGGGPLGTFDAIGSASANVENKTRSMAAAIVKNSIPALDSYGRQILTDGAALNDLADATNRATDANLGLFGSVTDVGAAEDAVTKSIEKNGRTLDAHTDKGRANRTALENLGRALQRNTEEYFAINGAGAKSQAVMASNRAAFQRAAQAMTGSKKAAEELTNALFGIPNRTVIVRVHQVSDGPERVDQSGHRYGGYYAHGGIKGAASGPVSSGLTMVGERGPEVLDLPPGTSVTTAGDTARMFAGARPGGQASGGQPLQINLVLDGHILAMAMVDPQRHLVRTQFGGSVQSAYGQG